MLPGATSAVLPEGGSSVQHSKKQAIETEKITLKQENIKKPGAYSHSKCMTLK